MNLEIKHLSPYLPYKLKILNGWGDIKTLTYTYLDDENNGFVVGVKPILNPLSDLTKEIEVNGEKFIPIEKLLDINSGHKWATSDYLITDNSVNEYWTGLKDGDTFGYNSEFQFFYILDKNYIFKKITNQLDLFQKLFEWHFDIFGLIDAGLAIDINTVKF